jgi:hypothetical protein
MLQCVAERIDEVEVQIGQTTDVVLLLRKGEGIQTAERTGSSSTEYRKRRNNVVLPMPRVPTMT